MRTSARVFVLAALCLLLSACVSAGSLANRGTSIDEGVGQMANRGILLNLARASRGEPLYFVSIGNIQATGSTDFRLGAPGFTEGASLPLAARQIIQSGSSTFLDNTINTNFQMGVFNTQTFYEGMLQPLGLNDIDLLLHQGFSREMVFYLVIEKAKITPCPLQPGSDPCIVYNDPANPSYLLFQGAIEAAMEHGLVTEVPQSMDSLVAPTNPNTDVGAADANAQARAAVSQVAVQSTGGGSAGKIDFVLKPQAQDPKAQLCFERALSTVAAKKEFDQLTSEKKPPFYCGTGHKRGNAALTVRLFDGRDYQIVVTTRSIYGIFNYLGEVMNTPEAQAPKLVDYHVPSEVTPAGPLLTVTQNGGILGAGCFSAVKYSGKYYCVPEESAQTTKQVFNVLSALVALKQSPGDLPASQTVLVAP